MKDFYFVEGSIDRHEAGTIIRTLTNALVDGKDIRVAIEATYAAGEPVYSVRIQGAVLHLPRETA
jgi:hypothetical protein